jgi:hypothetical protein
MSAGKGRLWAAAVVVVAWLSYLVLLAVVAGKPTVVSHPQFLVADLYVVAELRDGSHKPVALAARSVQLGSVPQPGWTSTVPWAELAQRPAEFVGDGPSEEVVIKEVLWPADRNQNLKETKAFVLNLRLCDHKYGWERPGLYVLPLTQVKGEAGPVYLVTPMPRSPGYDNPPRPHGKVGLPPSFIYRDTPEMRKQVEQLIKTYHGK